MKKVLYNENYNQLLLLTLILDIALFFLLFDNTIRLETSDFLYIYVIYVLHALFYWSLFKNKSRLISVFIHLILAVSVGFGLYVENFLIQLYILGMITCIHLLNLFDKKMMGKYQHSLKRFSVIYFLILSLRVGYRWGSI